MRTIVARVDTFSITKSCARRIWLHAQRLDATAPFGGSAAAVPACVRHLGYVQIDTIHVIERAHHHILYTRIPSYRREHLHRAQSIDKTVFEYWTHALSYVPVEDLRFYVRDMRRYWKNRSAWFGTVTDADVRRVLARIRRDGALTIRDIDDDLLQEKEHAWGTRKPSKRAMQVAFYKGLLTISGRTGMLKTYELMSRHFGWKRLPPAASPRATLDFLLDRALRSQGIVSVASICRLDAPRRAALRHLIETRVRRKLLVPVQPEGTDKPHWVRPETLDTEMDPSSAPAHILSPFDPLIAQRKRLQMFFGYEHRFEAYVPKARRVFGYFVCPVLIGERIVAALDLKTDRERRKLLVQKWNWIGADAARTHKRGIEEALHRFEQFQLAR